MLKSFASVLLMVVVGLVATGCGGDTPSSPSGGLDETVVLKLGNSVRVSDARFTMKFDGVVGDSRCPGDATCITGGDAVVAITVTPFIGQPSGYELHTGGIGTVRHGEFTISLEQLAPYPFSSRPFDPANYEASLRVTRAP